jgi:hypothetical protein
MIEQSSQKQPLFLLTRLQMTTASLHLTPARRELQEDLEYLTMSDIFNFAQVTQILLQTLPSLLSHDIFLLVRHEVVDIDKEIATLRVFYGRITVNQHLHRKNSTC